MNDRVKPIEATARQHHSPKIHSPVTVVTAFNTIIITMLRSVRAKLSKMKFVFVRRWRNFATETQIKLLPTTVAIIIKVNTAIWATTLTGPSSVLFVFPFTIISAGRTFGCIKCWAIESVNFFFHSSFYAKLRRVASNLLALKIFFIIFVISTCVLSPQTPANFGHLK